MKHLSTMTKQTPAVAASQLAKFQMAETVSEWASAILAVTIIPWEWIEELLDLFANRTDID